ncbi:hypothetical protein ACTXT7_014974 [Hymenolepis weldensis]
MAVLINSGRYILTGICNFNSTVKISHDISNAFGTTVSPHSSKNSTQLPVAPASPKMLPTTTPVEAANDDMKLYPSVRDNAKATNFTHSMESFMPKNIPGRLASEPTVPKQQSVPNSCLQIKYAGSGQKGCHTFSSSKTHTSSNKIKCLKFLGQSNHIRAKPKLVFPPKQSGPVDDKCNESEEIGLAKPASLANGTVFPMI